ncbi:esterase/lipase [Breznakia sp. PF5-3]|uniref:alpha/beta hydrolase n=1 Tax=unclassified Breznakia TaxID=2623764 RepID=UPI0024068409|nr:MULTISPECIES: alpha/beta fold hydrolase [unclassified Breznakia]MDF9825006.1 esterase/lipase [Breznakia sp. PM6-1]MDF9835423.1 esterase/lipase [Breznakia sp. PF5-3]MDF9837655.1 esterase/lipase [Breznakia sp. PFB2-8]MDF9859519.1 esterase/lipase [Breznakia sp. PH5-24]
MFEKLKAKFKKKPLILCIHGFGHRRSTEYNNFKLWGEDTYEFITFDIFDDQDDNDTNASIWIERCEKELEKLLPLQRDIYIIGFSMGGVLASYLASKYNVKKLFLIAPAFEFISLRSVVDTIMKIINNQPSELTMSNKQVSCFMEVVDRCKDDINLVLCPTLIVHGDNDQVIPLRSSINAYNKIQHDKKRLIILHEGPHRLMLDKKTNNEVYQLFSLFMQDKLITYTPQIAEDPYKKIEDKVQKG